jgi:hypothetical protein
MVDEGRVNAPWMAEVEHFQVRFEGMSEENGGSKRTTGRIGRAGDGFELLTRCCGRGVITSARQITAECS